MNIEYIIIAVVALAIVAYLATKKGGDKKPVGSGPPLKGIYFDWNTQSSTAHGSDNWPVTWGNDGHQYTAWGDGPGFGNTRRSLGFARLIGSPGNWHGENLSHNNGKSYGIVMIKGILYAFVTPGSGVDGYDKFSLWQSPDKGRTWRTLYTFQRHEGPGAGFITPAFLQFGKDYAGSDGFVYAYVIENTTQGHELTVQKPGRVYLLRCPVGGLNGKANWKAFDGKGWGSLKGAKPVFTDPRGVGWTLSVIYHPDLRRYILCTEHSETFNGLFQFHDAPAPWGPWHKFAEKQFPSQSFYLNFSQKWMRGAEFTAIYTGIGDGPGGDSLNTINGRFLT